MERHHVTLIIDRSASMGNQTMDVIEAINAFKHQLIKDVAESADVRVTLVLFDHEYIELCANTPIANVPDLTLENYVPRGTTALLEATFRAIKTTEEGMKSYNLGKARAVIAVMTDGGENASKEVTVEMVRDLIKSKEEDPTWAITFLGADPSTWDSSNQFGISSSNVAQIDKNNIRGSMKAYSGSVANYINSTPENLQHFASNMVSSNAAAFRDAGSILDKEAVKKWIDSDPLAGKMPTDKISDAVKTTQTGDDSPDVVKTTPTTKDES